MYDHMKMLAASEKRKQKMRALRLKGKTLAEIAKIMGVSRQRVQQVTGPAVTMRELKRTVDRQFRKLQVP